MSIVALSGGIGGAKLALGLSRVLSDETLTIIANTGDDFEHLGLSISPDIDTLLYTLSDLADRERGWGRRDETWSFMAALRALGGDDWFSLGDGDLATHLLRTQWLRDGATLSEVTERLRLQLGITARIVPMSDARLRTQLRSDAGWLDFQDYFVGQRCVPRIHEIRYAGADAAVPSPAVLNALHDPALRGIVICPSNPLLSIDPLLALPELRVALEQRRVPVIAVSPIIGGAAIKGPTAKLMQELGSEASASAVAQHYAGLIDHFLVDAADAEAIMPRGVQAQVAPIVMKTLDDREALARAVLALLA